MDRRLQVAEDGGYKHEYLKELAKIRLQSGYKNVKLGHLLFIDQKILGKIPKDEEAPSFDQPIL